MTLVVVGHDLQPSLSFLDDGAISLESNGIFVATDSAITRDYRDGRQIVLAGFRKAYAITAKLWQPSFIGEHFNGYRTVYQEIDCVLAFAGGILGSSTPGVELVPWNGPGYGAPNRLEN
ncbi:MULTISPECIES: hypothetical protein [Cobetia]|uniref:hypothetical protein n=1 Tax=Cobetia TaxID=204286 RepID=UPI00158417A1|nr:MULTISPECIES: hypothetical protein [Cobetia]MDI4662130.1 hypothetical protein [Cobetia sp. BMC6]NUJ57199.1 hypothetical protein [Cobetia marina]